MLELGAADTERYSRVQTKNLLDVTGLFSLTWRALCWAEAVASSQGYVSDNWRNKQRVHLLMCF